MLKLTPGQLFQKHYRIEQELGSGGMGVVYKASQLDVSRQVALKLLRPERVGKDSEFKRFLREFQILSKIAHPNVVLFYTHGITSEGIPYAVCEYLQGSNLQELLNAESKLEWRRVAKIAMQIAQGLQAVHSVGIVHRDLKPGNIMLCNLPEPDWVKIIDFGLARVEDQTALEQLTASGLLIGSVNYMSPEQCQAKPVEKRSDIYALGCIMYEMLTGEKLFNDTNPVALLHLHCNADLSERFSLLENLCPPEMKSLLRRMLAKSVADRPESMQEVADDLALLLQDPSATAHISPKMSMQKKSSTALFAALTIAVAFSLSFYFMFANRPQQKDISESGKTIVATPEAHVHVRRDFVAVVREAERLYPKDKDKNARKKIYQTWIDKYDHESLLKPSERALAYSQLLNVQNADEIDAATLKKCSTLLNQISIKDVLERNLSGRFLISMSAYYLKKGNRQLSIECAERLFKAYQDIDIQKNDQIDQECVSILATLGKYPEALDLEKKVIAERDAFDPEFHQRAGKLCVLNKRPQEALNYYKVAMGLLDRKASLAKKSATVTTLADAGIVAPGGPHFLLPGRRQDLKELYCEKYADLAKAAFHLDKKLAKELVGKAVSKADEITESSERIDHIMNWLGDLESVASQLDLQNERQICAAKIILLRKVQIQEPKSPSAKFEMQSDLAYRLYAEGQTTQALKYFREASANYTSSPDFHEMCLIRQTIDMARVCASDSMNKSEAETLFQQSRALLKKYQDEAIPAQIDASEGLFFSCSNKQADAERSFEKAMKKCLKPKSENIDSLCRTFDHMLLARRYDQCKRLFQTSDNWEDACRLTTLAERELSDGFKEAAKNDFQLAYQQFFHARTDSGWPEDYVRCQAGIIAASR